MKCYEGVCILFLVNLQVNYIFSGRVMLSSVASVAPPYFLKLSHERQDFWKKFTEHKICVLILSTMLPEKFIILRRT
jgi:hypothetical protein